MRALSNTDVLRASVEVFGLDANKVGLSTVVAIACCLRRAAGFLCPCSDRTLIHAVVDPLRSLIDNHEDIRRTAEDTLEALVAHGDLLELSDISREESNSKRALLYLAPPVYVRRQSGAIILLGVLPDNISLIPEEIEKRVEYLNHVRILRPKTGEDIEGQLKELGYIQLTESAWQKAPNAETPTEHLERMNRLLDATPAAGEVPGLHLLDPECSVLYYRGRWVVPGSHTGRFVGRRPQAYGADLWCFIEVKDGNPIKLMDLPLKNSKFRGCDEAWRIQTAIDHERGTPQIFKVEPGSDDTKVLGFSSPVPMWVKRRLEIVGESVVHSGCLFSYRLKENEVSEEVQFLKEYAWLSEAC